MIRPRAQPQLIWWWQRITGFMARFFAFEWRRRQNAGSGWWQYQNEYKWEMEKSHENLRAGLNQSLYPSGSQLATLTQIVNKSESAEGGRRGGANNRYEDTCNRYTNRAVIRYFFFFFFEGKTYRQLRQFCRHASPWRTPMASCLAWDWASLLAWVRWTWRSQSVVVAPSAPSAHCLLPQPLTVGRWWGRQVPRAGRLLLTSSGLWIWEDSVCKCARCGAEATKTLLRTARAFLGYDCEIGTPRWVSTRYSCVCCLLDWGGISWGSITGGSEHARFAVQ